MKPEAILQYADAYAVYDLVLLLPALGVWILYQRAVLRIPLSLAFNLRRLGLQLLSGAGYGLLALLLAVMPGWLAKAYAQGPGYAPFNYPPASAGSVSGLTLWGMFAVQSLFEELLYRVLGVLLLGTFFFWLSGTVLRPTQHKQQPLSVASQRWLSAAWLSCGLLSNAVVSVGFGLVHGHNPHINTLALANIALAGLAMGQLCWMQGSPLGASALHLVWNAGLATLGLPVSGLLFSAPLLGFGFHGARDGLLSGGAFGPEASLPGTCALAAVFALLLVLTYRGALSLKHPDISGSRPLPSPPL